MNSCLSDTMLQPLSDDQLLKTALQHILGRQDLTTQRTLLKTVMSEFNTDSLECASALLYLLQHNNTAALTELINQPLPVANLPVINPLTIKMVRYRLAVGSQHQLTVDLLKQVLVEESGVDKKNINNITIHDHYTLIDLPDEMPLDIFQHLKTVEINQQKLDIRRVKSRHKKRGHHHRRGRQQTVKNNTNHVLNT